jgi:hypothetical protein
LKEKRIAHDALRACATVSPRVDRELQTRAFLNVKRNAGFAVERNAMLHAVSSSALENTDAIRIEAGAIDGVLLVGRRFFSA